LKLKRKRKREVKKRTERQFIAKIFTGVSGSSLWRSLVISWQKSNIAQESDRQTVLHDLRDAR
jgi:hypothetical protein